VSGNRNEIFFGRERQVITIGLIGDYNATVVAHRAIPTAISLAPEAQQIDVGFEWVPTEEITSVERIARFKGLWCVPGSPYRSMDGALRAIRFAREARRPYVLAGRAFNRSSQHKAGLGH
jgi:CTP synthase (UTP-ammonia lyase)